MFEPVLFISTGRTDAMYTLRETYQHCFPDGTADIRSMHLVNLSTDFSQAKKKAFEYAEGYGVPLGASDESEMREIIRRTPEQIAEAKRQSAELRLEHEARMAVIQAEIKQKQIEVLNKGLIPFGKYKDWRISKCPIGYINWLADKVGEFDDDSIIKLVAEKIKAEHKGLILPKPRKNKIAGEVGDRLEFSARVVKQAYFDSMYGRTYITTLVSSDKTCLVVKSGAFYPDVGEKLKFKGTVKEHSDYQGQSQTVLQRVALAK